MTSLQKKIIYLTIAVVFLIVTLQIVSLKAVNLDGSRWLFNLLKGHFYTDDQFQRYTTLFLQVITSSLSSILPDQNRLVAIKYLFSFFYMAHPIISISFCYFFLKKNNRLHEIIFPIINYLALSLPGFSFAASSSIEAPSYLWPLVFILTNKANSKLMISLAMTISLLIIFTYLISIVFFVLLLLFLLFRKNEFCKGSLPITVISLLVSSSFYLHKWIFLISQNKKSNLVNDIMSYTVDHVLYTHLPFLILILTMVLFFTFYKYFKLKLLLIIFHFLIFFICAYQIYTNQFVFNAYFYRILIIPLSASLLISFFIVKIRNLPIFSLSALLFFTPPLLLGLYFDLNSSFTFLEIQKIIKKELAQDQVCSYIKAPIHKRFQELDYNTDFLVPHSIIFSDEFSPQKILVAKEIGFWQNEHYPSINTCYSYIKDHIPIYLNKKFQFFINTGDSSLLDLTKLSEEFKKNRRMLVMKSDKDFSQNYILFSSDSLKAKLKIESFTSLAYILSPMVDTSLFDLKMYSSSKIYTPKIESNRFYFKDIESGVYTIEIIPSSNLPHYFLLSPLIIH